MTHLPVEFRTAPWKDRTGRVSPLKAVTLVALFIPAVLMLNDYVSGTWIIPVVGLIYWSGVWATIMLLLALFITPARRIYRWRRGIEVRRMIGVGALAYTLAHVAFYFWLRFFDPSFIITETATRFTLIVATISFVGLVTLGLTSFDASIKWLGGGEWDRLHKITYAATGLAVLHFMLSPGAYAGLPFLMVGVFFWLMAWRALDRRRLGERIGVLAGLTIAATALTVLLEAVWPALMLGMDPWITLSWNFSLELGISPGWIVLALGAAVTLTAAIRQRFFLNGVAQAAK